MGLEEEIQAELAFDTLPLLPAPSSCVPSGWPDPHQRQRWQPAPDDGSRKSFNIRAPFQYLSHVAPFTFCAIPLLFVSKSFSNAKPEPEFVPDSTVREDLDERVE